MDATSSQKRAKRQRFQPFIIKKGIVMRAKQRQKMALELSKSKNDSTMYNDPKLIQLRSNNRSLSRALAEQKIESKCLADEKIQLQREMLANHEIILALRTEVKTHEEDLLQIHEAFRSSLQLLVSLTGHLNVGLQRCASGRRRSKSVSMGAAGRSFGGAGAHNVLDGGAGPSPRQNGGGGGSTNRKLHKVLPTVAGNVISHPSIVLPRLPAGGGWFGPTAADARRAAEPEPDLDGEDQELEQELEEEEEEAEESEPLAEPGERVPTSMPLADLSVILEQSVLDGDGVSPLRRSRLEAASPAGSPQPAARRSTPLRHAQVVVPAEERLFGDEAWMRQRTPGRERVVVAAEERLNGDEAWLRQRRRGPVRVPVPVGQRLSGDEPWRGSDGDGTESPPIAATPPAACPRGRPSNGAAVADTGRMPPDAVNSGRFSRSPHATDAALCNGNASSADLEESVVIRRRTQQRPRAPARLSAAPAEEGAPGQSASADQTADVADPDESVVVSRRVPAPAADVSVSQLPCAAEEQDESIVVSRKAGSANRAAVSQRAVVHDADESIIVSRRAAAPDPDESILTSRPVAELDADQSVVITRKVRGRPRKSVTPAATPPPPGDADESVVISRKVRGRPRSSAAPAAGEHQSAAISRKARPPSSRSASASPRRNRRSRAARGPRPASATPASPDHVVIGRDEFTPSPELGVRERYTHASSRTVTEAGDVRRVAPCSGNDPLEGPSHLIWVSAESPDGRWQRQRQRSVTRSSASPSPRRRRRSGSTTDDVKLVSPVMVLVNRADAAAAAAASSAASVAPPTAKRGRRRRAAEGPAGDGAAVSSPAAKRGRGRGRGRGHGSRRSVSVEPLPPVPVPDWDTVSLPAAGGGGRAATATEPELFVYPELPAVPPEELPPPPARLRRSASQRVAASSRRNHGEGGGAAAAAGSATESGDHASDGGGGGGWGRTSVTERCPGGPTVDAPAPVAESIDGRRETDAVPESSDGQSRPEDANGLVAVVVAEPSSTTGPPPPPSGGSSYRDPSNPFVNSRQAVESSNSAPAGGADSSIPAPPTAADSDAAPPAVSESSHPAPPAVSESDPAPPVVSESSVPSPPVVSEPSDPAPPVVSEPSDPAPPVVSEPSDPALPLVSEPSDPALPRVSESSDPAPPATVEPSIPALSVADDSVPVVESRGQAASADQGSPGSSDDPATERHGRRRRKPVSYAEPSLNKKLRRQR